MIITSTLRKNIINKSGQRGQIWINNLPRVVSQLCSLWSLSETQPVSNMSWHYVATALHYKREPVVLKIGFDNDVVHSEYHALQYMRSEGIIEVLDYSQEFHAILMKQAIPGTTLNDSPISPDKKMEIYAGILKNIADVPCHEKSFEDSKSWFAAIDSIDNVRIPPEIVQKARHIRDDLFARKTNRYLCHGDLHMDNIIDAGDKWVAIDPKGVLGVSGFEAAAFDLCPTAEIIKISNNELSDLVIEKSRMLSDKTDIILADLYKWIFLRVLLSACWFIEDGGDPSPMIRLTHVISKLV